MKKEKIAFFLGSSIDEFQKERKDLKSFALDNNRLLSRVGVEIEFYLCEDAQDKSQTAIDAYIQKNADVCIFLLGKTVGDVTDHEIGVAGEIRKQTDNVRPAWQFFAKSDSTLSFESVSREVKDYADKINKTYGGQYVTPFFNSAEMKITILQSALLKLDRLKDLSAEDGKLTLNGVVVSDISFDDIPEYANNRTYRKLKSEIEELEQRFQSLDPKTQMQEMLSISGQINEKTSLLRQLEKETVGVMNNVFLRLREDHVDETVKKTYALLREGKLEEAKECISLEELRENDEALLGAQAMVIDGAKKNVEQAQARIDVWKTDAENPERFDEIQKTYESVWNSILISDSFGMGIDYFDFLLEQNRHEDADKMFPRLTAFIEDHHAPKKWKDMTYNEIGRMFRDQNRLAEAEDFLLKTLPIRKDLSISNSEEYNDDLATYYNNLGALFSDQNRLVEAEEYFQNALTIWQELAKSNPEKNKGNLARSYNNLGRLFCVQNRLAEAEECYQNALTIRQELAKNNPEKYNGDLSVTFNSLGALFYDQNRLAEAEEYLQNALTIWKELAKSNPEKYNDVLATSYNNLGALFYKQNRLAEAEECYQNALEIQQELAKNNPEKYNGDLATSYKNFGRLYLEQNRLVEAECCYKESLILKTRKVFCTLLFFWIPKTTR